MNLNQKLVEEKSVHEAEDRLGGLPDHILHHILSFLPTKYAVRTSVLSTRWEYAWTSISVLDFYDNDHSDDSADSDGWENDREREDQCKNKPDLMDFVDRTLLLHDGTKLQKFRLTCKECDAFRLNSWISTVIRQKVEEIFLCIGWMKWPFVFPRSFFTCESMTKLEIGLKFRESGVKIPNSVCMPNLKDLVLNHTSFSCDHATQKVFFSFPSLEFLSIFYCNWVNIKITTICASRLKELVVRDSCYDDCEIKVYAEKLTSFYFFDALVRKYTLCNLSSIGYARIEINEDNIPGVHSSKFLRGISKVKDLSVTSGTIHNLLNGIKSGDLLTFPYLTTLRFTPHRTSHHEQFTRLFHMLPKLESIIFYNTCPLRLKEDDWSFATMPQCLLSHLKSVELRNFSGNENGLFLIVFFLKHACVLERMTVVASTLLKADLKQNTEVSRQIRMFPRVSTCCRIEFF